MRLISSHIIFFFSFQSIELITLYNKVYLILLCFSAKTVQIFGTYAEIYLKRVVEILNVM